MKISHQESIYKRKSRSFYSASNARITESRQNFIPYSSSATYALQRRLIVPTWWVESILYTHGKKQAWYEDFLSNKIDTKIYEYFKVTPANIFFMFFLWHELSKQLFTQKKHNCSKIRFDLTSFLHGTPKNQENVLKKLEENLITSAKIFKISAIKSKDKNELVISPKGFVNIFRQISLEKNVHGIWLTLYFSQKLSNLFVAPDCTTKIQSTSENFITINPNLFYAMGSKVNLQIALNGLFLEYQKKRTQNIEDYTICHLDNQQLSKFHKTSVATQKLLFDHGIIKGHINPPSSKISHLKKNYTHFEKFAQPSMIFSWHISTQTKEAKQFEETLSKELHLIREEQRIKQKSPLFHEPPQDELQKARVSHVKVMKSPNTSTLSLKNKTYPCLDKPSIQLNDKVNKLKQMSQTQSLPNFHTCSIRELSIFVARFYESLNQKQKKMFELERKKMNNEQFRAFMIPILQRTQSQLKS